MNRRQTWLLSGLLVFILAACAGAQSASPATPTVQTIMPTAETKAESSATPVAAQPTTPTIQASTPTAAANAESLWQKNQEGDVVVELQPLNLAEPEAAPKD